MAYELPEDLGAQSPDQLQALIDQGLDALRALGVTEDSDDETLTAGERIVGLINEVQAALTDKQTRATRAQGVKLFLDTPPPPAVSTDEPPAEEGGDEPEAPAETPAEEPGSEGGDAETITPDEVIQPVAASTSPARRAAANAAKPIVPRHRPPAASLTAAADVPGLPTGATLDGLDAVGDAVIRRMRSLPTTRVGGTDGVRMQYGAAIIRKNGYDGLTQDNNDFDDHSLVWATGNESRLPGGSLVAAGGWCAPSETLYDLCQFESVEGLLSIPEFQVTRGGIRWTQGPDFSDIYEACGFFITNAQAEAGGPFDKTCCMVECPPFDEIRLEAIGLCVKTPLLTNATYPELVRRFMEGALVAHQHKVNKYLLDQIKAAAGTPFIPADTGSVIRTLEAIQYTAIGMRYRHRLGQSTTIEVVMPLWFRGMLIADLTLRQMPPASADAFLNAWFADRMLAPQWVFDLDDPTVNGCDVDFPECATALLYPAGTWSRGSLDVINIDAVYDSTGLADNVFTALFMEEGILAVQRCTHTCAVCIPVCVSGRTAANDISECLVVNAGSGGGGGGGGATGATAGTPGTWTPSGSAPSASAADANGDGIVASPATAWTTGQYVVSGGGDIHWNGTSWVAGRAP